MMRYTYILYTVFCLSFIRPYQPAKFLFRSFFGPAPRCY